MGYFFFRISTLSILRKKLDDKKSFFEYLVKCCNIWNFFWVFKIPFVTF